MFSTSVSMLSAILFVQYLDGIRPRTQDITERDKYKGALNVYLFNFTCHMPVVPCILDIKTGPKLNKSSEI